MPGPKQPTFLYEIVSSNEASDLLSVDVPEIISQA